MLRVVVLCHSISRSTLIWQKLSKQKGITLFSYVFRPKTYSKIWFFLYSGLHMLKSSLLHPQAFLAMLLSGRLHISLDELHTPASLQWFKAQAFDIGLHAANVIYRKPLLDTFKRGILNPHIGILPEYRGRSVMEWSILQGDETGITTFFIDEGIDTGRTIVLRIPVPTNHFKTVRAAKEYLFSLDVAMWAAALDALQQVKHPFIYQEAEEGKRYYVMSELFTDAVNAMLASQYSPNDT